MSLILKGIDLPKGYGHIHLEIYPNGDVEAEWDQDSKDYRAIQIPKGHGRLIDGDLLKDMIRDSVPAYGIGVKIPTYGDMDIMDKISIMPTILEAEE